MHQCFSLAYLSNFSHILLQNATRPCVFIECCSSFARKMQQGFFSLAYLLNLLTFCLKMQQGISLACLSKFSLILPQNATYLSNFSNNFSSKRNKALTLHVYLIFLTFCLKIKQGLVYSSNVAQILHEKCNKALHIYQFFFKFASKCNKALALHIIKCLLKICTKINKALHIYPNLSHFASKRN